MANDIDPNYADAYKAVKNKLNIFAMIVSAPKE